jgi:glycosyltransferase involved in cell wall biosynthesis
MHLTHVTINPIDYERRIINQAKTAVDGKFQVLVIAFGHSGEPSQEVKPYGRLKRIISPFTEGGPLKFVHFNFRLLFILLRTRTDIIHAHDLWVLPAATVTAALKRKKLIYDAHEYYAGLEIFNHHRFRRFLWLLLESLFVRFVDVLVTVSEPLADLYRARYPSVPECRVIRNLPLKEDPSPALAESLPENFQYLLVYHGHLKPGRGLENLVRAMATVKNAGLILIGGGELMVRLQDLIANPDTRDKVMIRSYVSLESLISTSARADIGVALFEKTSVNYSYALPNKFFEYIMAGLPVLASDIETLKEYVDRYDIGRTVDPSDPEHIARTIEEMLSDPKRLEKWRRNTRSAAKLLNWNTESVEMLRIYENLDH